MNKEEYKKEHKRICDKFTDSIEELRIAFMNANALAEIGDQVDNTVSKIKVDKVTYGWMEEKNAVIPLIGYAGILLTKNGAPYKSGECRFVGENDNYFSVNGVVLRNIYKDVEGGK